MPANRWNARTGGWIAASRIWTLHRRSTDSTSIFPIVQGSTYKDLRVASAEAIAERGAAGNAIGGLSVGEPHEDMYAMTEVVCGVLPEDNPGT